LAILSQLSTVSATCLIKQFGNQQTFAEPMSPNSECNHGQKNSTIRIVIMSDACTMQVMKRSKFS
jgi:hypothetical protein